MGQAMTKLHLDHVHSYMKGGRLYHYFRRAGQNIRLRGQPGSKEFMAAYQAALAGKPDPIGAAKSAPGSMSALAAAWYATKGFRSLAPNTVRKYRRVLDAFLRDHGDKPAKLIEPRHIRDILEARSETPAEANTLRGVLRLLLQYGFERDLLKDNPARDVKPLRYKKKPFATWTDEDIATFEERWPRGTRARLALSLLLYTGQRRGDVIRMGPQHIVQDHLIVRQQKTGTELAIPLHPELRAELADAPKGHLAFLVTVLGAPFASGTAFYNWFVDCARRAGIAKGLSPHGLRKATARRLASAGCTPHQIMSITGHRTLKEVELYTREANQRRLAGSALVHLTAPAKG
jgi:integrase